MVMYHSHELIHLLVYITFHNYESIAISANMLNKIYIDINA